MSTTRLMTRGGGGGEAEEEGKYVFISLSNRVSKEWEGSFWGMNSFHSFIDFTSTDTESVLLLFAVCWNGRREADRMLRRDVMRNFLDFVFCAAKVNTRVMSDCMTWKGLSEYRSRNMLMTFCLTKEKM